MLGKIRSDMQVDQVLALSVGIISGLNALFHGWQAGLLVFFVGNALIIAGKWIDRDTAWIIKKLQQVHGAVLKG